MIRHAIRSGDVAGVRTTHRTVAATQARFWPMPSNHQE